MLGMIGNPIVTLLWLLEQVDFHILGASTKSSDIRILLSFLMNAGFVVAMYFLAIY